MSAILCGGEPTPADLATIQEFGAALAQPTQHLQRLALIEMGDTAAEKAALASHRLDPEPWDVGDPRDGRSLRSATEATGAVEWCDFDPRPGFCQHRECYA